MPDFTYIPASRPYGAICVGSINDLRHRVEQHRTEAVDSHTKNYGIHILVWFEMREDYREAVARELKIKKWKRLWKNDLIIAVNPEWRDLTSEIPL